HTATVTVGQRSERGPAAGTSGRARRRDPRAWSIAAAAQRPPTTGTVIHPTGAPSHHPSACPSTQPATSTIAAAGCRRSRSTNRTGAIRRSSRRGTIRRQHHVDRTIHDDTPVPKPDTAGAQLAHLLELVGHEQQGASPRMKRSQPFEASLAE